MTEPKLTKEIIDEILSVPVPFDNSQQEQACRSMLKNLSKGQIEVLAQTSYAYWVASTTWEGPISDDIRERQALKEVRRHLVGSDTPKTALNLVKSTIDFRKERKINLCRTCLDDTHKYNRGRDEILAKKYKEYITKELESQTSIIRGLDKDNRALLLCFPRTSADDVDDGVFILTQLYLVERAIACTEIASRGTQENVLVIFDFRKFQSKFSPSIPAVRELVTILQSMYPERLKNLIVIDPPIWIRTVYRAMRPFLDPETNSKFILVCGNRQKNKIIGKLVDKDHAMPFLLPNGMLSQEVDSSHFLQNVPFHCLYDDGNDAACV